VAAFKEMALGIIQALEQVIAQMLAMLISKALGASPAATGERRQLFDNQHGQHLGDDLLRAGYSRAISLNAWPTVLVP